jgi:transmembrane sensor
MENKEINKASIERYFSGDGSAEDSHYVRSLMCDSAYEKELQRVLSRQFSALAIEEENRGVSLDHILHRIHYNINSNEAGKKSRASGIVIWILRIAAVIVLPVMVYWGISGYFNLKEREQAWVEIKAPAWTRAQFTLPDGTMGWLNSNSSIKYNLDFVNNRRLKLNGEAFFDVFRDRERPFSVMTGSVVLKVLGTKFNVASYADEPDVEVVLEEGSLVVRDSLGKSHHMDPNDLVTLNKRNGGMTTEMVQTQKYLSWKEGKLVFRNDPLDVICRRLARWYNVDVEVNVASVDNLRLRATFIDESLESVLDLLKRSLPINYRIEGGKLGTDNTYSKKRVIILPR